MSILVAVADAVTHDPITLLVGVGPVGVIAALFALGKLKTPGDLDTALAGIQEALKREQERADRAEARTDRLEERLRTLTDAAQRETITALAESTAAVREATIALANSRGRPTR